MSTSSSSGSVLARGEPKDVFSLLPEHNDASSTRDILRWGGAQAVCVGHALSFFGVGDNWRAPNFPYMQNIGVLVFFVLSGFVIAHALVRVASRPQGGLAAFIVDRFVRIYTALLPAMVLHLKWTRLTAWMTCEIFIDIGTGRFLIKLKKSLVTSNTGRRTN